MAIASLSPVYRNTPAGIHPSPVVSAAKALSSFDDARTELMSYEYAASYADDLRPAPYFAAAKANSVAGIASLSSLLENEYVVEKPTAALSQAQLALADIASSDSQAAIKKLGWTIERLLVDYDLPRSEATPYKERPPTGDGDRFGI